MGISNQIMYMWTLIPTKAADTRLHRTEALLRLVQDAISFWPNGRTGRH